MSLAWLMPAALIGLALVALPIAVHLLVREHSRILAYPSLRFLRETQLAAFRRRTIQDAALLACRVAIISLATLALSGPVLQTQARTAAYAKRTSRAIVTMGQVDQQVIARAREGAFRSDVFARLAVVDALADAGRWLDRQPPSAREIVVIGELSRGAIAASDLAAVDGGIGIRFEPADASASTVPEMTVLTRRNGVLTRIDRKLQVDVDSTRVTDGVSASVRPDLVAIVARPVDTPLAEAALRAALGAGVPWTDFDRRAIIVWDGADEAEVARRAANARIVRMPVPAPAAAANEVREALMRVSPPDLKDPVWISVAQLGEWTRSPGPPSTDAPSADEGDRRWLWAGALLLLGLEAWLRRSVTPVRERAVDPVEARVA
jgi:Aerotolerance regulator N-terminal